MTSPLRTGRHTAAALIACLALVGCGSSGATPSHAAIVAVASPIATPDPTPTPTQTGSIPPAVSLEPTPAADALAAVACDRARDRWGHPAGGAGVPDPVGRPHRRQRRRATPGGIQRGIAGLPGSGRRRRDPLHVRLPGRRGQDDRPRPERPPVLRPLGRRVPDRTRPLRRRLHDAGRDDPPAQREIHLRHRCPARLERRIPPDQGSIRPAQRIHEDRFAAHGGAPPRHAGDAVGGT